MKPNWTTGQHRRKWSVVEARPEIKVERTTTVELCVRSGFYRHKKTPADAGASLLAEAEGFEPPVPFGTPVFKTGAIDQLCQTSGGAKIQHVL